MAKNNGTGAQAAEMTTQARKASRVAAVTLGLAVAADILFFALAFRSGAWQLFAWGIDVFGLVIVLLLSVRLIRRGHPVLSVWLMFSGLAVVVSLATLWTAGLGLALGLGCVIALSQMAVHTLPPKQISWGFIASVAAGAAVLLLDAFGLADRLAAPSEMMTFIPFITALAMPVFGFLLVRQFANYTLHTKLVIVLLIVTLTSVGLLAFLNNRATRTTLTDDANQALFAAGSQTTANIDAFINTNLDVIRTEAQLPLWSQYLKLVADQRSDSEVEAEIRTTLRALSRKTNISSYALLDHQGRDVMDTFASHIGTDKSDRGYFQEPLKSGLPYVSPVEFSPATGKASLYFSSPVRNSAGRIVGVLRMRYDATVLQTLVVQNSGLAGPGSFAVLFDEYHIRLAHGTTPEMILRAVAPPDPAQVAELQATRRLPHLPAEELSTDLPALEQNLTNAADQPYFVVEDATVSGQMNQAAVTALKTRPWLVVFFQPQDVFLAPVKAQERSAVVLTVVITVVAVATALGLAQVLAGPIIRLTAVAASVTAGDLNAQARVESGDEIGALATTFNTMTRQLRGLISGLEQRVEERTRGLQTAAEVSRATTSMLDPDQLLHQVVDLVRERFDLYYVGLFLLDKERHFAVLQAGTGEAGRQMLAQGHKLEMGGDSMIGQCVARSEARIALDVGEEAVRFDNPFLPNTRSELALPLRSRGRVIGAMTVQSVEEAAFDEAYVAILQTMADQVAVAIDNARLFAETQAALEAAEATHRRYLRQEWTAYLPTAETIRYETRRRGVAPLDDAVLPEIQQAVKQRGATVLTSDDDARRSHSALVAPITLRGGEVIGALGLHGDEARQWTDDEIALVEVIAQRLALAADNLRLLDRTQGRAAHEQLTREITDKMQQASDMGTLIQYAIQELQSTFGASYAVVHLGTEDELLTRLDGDA